MVDVDERDGGGGRGPAVPPRRRRVQRVPAALLLPAALGLGFLVLPLAGLVIRAPWATLPQRLTEPGVFTALRLSLQTATFATVACVVVGVPLAWLLARVDRKSTRLNSSHSQISYAVFCLKKKIFWCLVTVLLS